MDAKTLYEKRALYKGKQCRAIIDCPEILYTYANGGGCRSNARTVKEGDVFTIEEITCDLHGYTVRISGIIYRIGADTFLRNFRAIMPIVFTQK